MGGRKGDEHDDDQGDGCDAGGKAEKQKKAAHHFKKTDAVGGGDGMGDVQRLEIGDYLFDMGQLAHPGYEKLVPPRDPHIEDEEALKGIADFKKIIIEPADPMQKAVFEHTAPLEVSKLFSTVYGKGF